MKRVFTLSSEITAYNTIGTDGGITTPMVPAAAIRAAAESSRYPRFFNSGISVAPTAAVVAAPEPEIAAKNMPARTDTMERPPFNIPSKDSANSTSTLETFPFARRSPAKMKKGTAIREKESVLANIRCTRIRSFTSPFKRTRRAAAAIANATGTPIRSRTIKEMNNKAAMLCLLLSK